ncbi:sigma-70 family RNA polymerase sigma factor [Planctomycetales bacterium ZRK34]|nr:sigma-70 family RNA polymerase sigma factor [Planctomycetales bacterium ZRK34]
MAGDQRQQDGQFARLWVKSQPIVTAFVRTLVTNLADADDLVQNIAAEAMVDFDKFDPTVGTFTGWAIGIARYRVLNHYRTTRRDRHVFSEKTIDRLIEAHQRIDTQADAFREALEHCLDRLPARQRAMIDLRYIDELGREQIASQLKTTGAAVAMALVRIRRALASCIQMRVASERSRG